MLRYVRLYLYFLRFSFSRALQFRLDFFFRVGMDIIFYAVNLAFFSLLFAHTGTLGGWSMDQVLVFVGGVFFSTLLSFFLVPATYVTVDRGRRWIGTRLRPGPRRAAEAVEPAAIGGS